MAAFTLVTGVNGSGKTHLLQAIQNGSLRVDGLEIKQIKYFDWTTLSPGEGGAFRSDQDAGRREKLSRQINESFVKASRELGEIARSLGLPDVFLEWPIDAARLSVQDISKYLSGSPRRKIAEAHDRLQSALQACSSNIKQHLERDKSFSAITQLEQRSGLQIALWDPDKVLDALKWGETDAFFQDFSRLFGTYRDLLLKNTLARYRTSQGDKVEFLSDEEFITKYNRPPWDLLNGVLLEMGLDFSADPPDLDDYSPYELNLRKNSTGINVDIQHLSSGEKIIMSFVNSLYYARDHRQVSTFPRMLLLDEVDAPLHPSMARGLIRVITETLVRDLDIAVVAATHSASTVAMAPEEAVHVMKVAVPGIQKVSKNQALAVLTTGVPTLSVNVDGRRQVFVESQVDVRAYEGLYQAAKKFLNSERSLAFLAPGSQGKGGDIGTGCGAVRTMVKQLAKLGNKSVLGLIDWDGKNEPSDRVKVIAHGKRNGIENCLLDPLLLSCVVARHGKNVKERIGMSRNVRANHLKQVARNELQEIVDLLQELVLGGDILENGSRINVKYSGGLELLSACPRSFS